MDNNNTEQLSIYAYNNPYGFRLNINHPKIKELYDRYKKWKGFAGDKPISDKDRIEFEKYIFNILDRQGEI